jgi:hypothetical protein
VLKQTSLFFKVCGCCFLSQMVSVGKYVDLGSDVLSTIQSSTPKCAA